jgi:hypothetical protein
MFPIYSQYIFSLPTFVVKNTDAFKSTSAIYSIHSRPGFDLHHPTTNLTNGQKAAFVVNDQLGAQFFSMYLFQFCTCFEQPLAHHQENQLYQYNLWYMSLCVGDHFMCRSESNFLSDHNKVHSQ